jgi:hypothetical protein
VCDVDAAGLVPKSDHHQQTGTPVAAAAVLLLSSGPAGMKNRHFIHSNMTLTADKDIEALLHDLFEDELECQQQPPGVLLTRTRAASACWQCTRNRQQQADNVCRISGTFLAAHPFVDGLIHIRGFLSKRQQV